MGRKETVGDMIKTLRENHPELTRQDVGRAIPRLREGVEEALGETAPSDDRDES